MRRALDWLYRGSAALAAVFLVAICVVVAVQVAANAANALYGAVTGRALGWMVPSYADFAGYFLGASAFLGLAPTLRTGGHVRVGLLLDAVAGGKRRLLEGTALVAGVTASGYFAFYMARLVAESLRFGDVSPGIVAVPLWLPQSALALGLVVLTISLTDDLVAVLRGQPASYQQRADDGPIVLPG